MPGQTMRVKQFELFREDIRDLMELTTAKMDNYLIATRRDAPLVFGFVSQSKQGRNDSHTGDCLLG